MRKLLHIFALLLLLSCHKEDIIKSHSYCYRMVLGFSDALPVQFWVNGVETFNEKEPFGIHRFCFCQPINETDEINIQFSEEGDTFYIALSYVVLDSQGTVLAENSITEISSGVWSFTFVPLDEGIQDMDIHIIIVIPSLATRFLAPNTWTIDPGFTWSTSATLFSKFVSTTSVSSIGYQPLVIESGKTISFDIIIDLISGTYTGLTGSVYFVILDSLDVAVSNLSAVTLSTLAINSYTTHTITLTTTGIGATLYFIGSSMRVQTGSVTLEVAPPVGDIIYTPDASIIGQSDCLSVKEDHEDTILLTYSNRRDFVDINNADVSPDTEFNLRFPAVFFHEEYPQEQEILELSDSQFVPLNSKTEEQRLIETGYMPYYMHKKLILALQFQQNYIDGEQWIKKEAYEIVKGRKTYPLKMGRVLLNKANFVKRNVI